MEHDAVSVPCSDNLMAPLRQEQSERRAGYSTERVDKIWGHGIAFHFLYAPKVLGPRYDRHLVNVLE